MCEGVHPGSLKMALGKLRNPSTHRREEALIPSLLVSVL